VKFLSINKSDKLAIVDDEDFDRLSGYVWWDRSSIYRVEHRHYKTYHYSMANTVMNNYDVMYDHKDRNALNNQKENLRVATYSQNCRNVAKKSNTSSKYKGVSYHKSKKKWIASIRKDFILIHLGYFELEVDAAKAYDAKAKEIDKEFAVLNFPGLCGA
jgi:hypothetical protein